MRVGDQSYTVEEVQRYIDRAALNLQMTVGMEAADIYEDPQEFLSEAAEYFVTKKILEDKFAEYGLDELSEDDEQALNLAAQQAYEQIWQAVSKQIEENYPDFADGDRVVTETMETAGYSMDDLYDAARRELLQQRLLKQLCPDTDMTIEEARDWYLQEQVEPCRERYESDVPLFEQEILIPGSMSAYVPEGYYYIKYISLKPDGDIADALQDAELTVIETAKEKQAAYDALAQAALMEDADPAAAREGYRKAEQALQEAESVLETAIAAAEEAFQPMADVVKTAMNDGVSFEELINRYSSRPEMNSADEPGFPFHPDSEVWDARIREAATGLKRYGECTDPVYSSGSIFIICRMDDMAGGAYEPTGEELDSIRENLLLVKQAQELEALVQEYRREYDISIDISQLSMP